MIDSASEQASTLRLDHRKSCDGRLRFDANQEHIWRVRRVLPRFLSCLRGSEHFRDPETSAPRFLSCLRGSEPA